MFFATCGRRMILSQGIVFSWACVGVHGLTGGAFDATCAEADSDAEPSASVTTATKKGSAGILVITYVPPSCHRYRLHNA